MALAEVSLHVLGELLDDDIDILPEGVIVVDTASYLTHSLWGGGGGGGVS